jgi:hypothetical protein
LRDQVLFEFRTKSCLSLEMAKQISAIAGAACIALASSGVPVALAKQQCSAARPSDPHGHWWSYRLIDGRKCWYEGKPGFSKSLLEWRVQTKAQIASNGSSAGTRAEKPRNPLDSQAWDPTDADTFEARWRLRVQQNPSDPTSDPTIPEK